MKPLHWIMVLSGLAVFTDRAMPQDEPSAADRLNRQLNTARKVGLQAALQVTGVLERTDRQKFPAIAVFSGQIREAVQDIDRKMPADQWPAFDVDKLLANNPAYWAAVYEVAPADPGMYILHSGLLIAEGEITRGAHVALIGVRSPAAKPLLPALKALYGFARQVERQAAGMVQVGIMRHDAKDYQGALEAYREVLQVFPRYGFAHYEVGFSLRTEAAGAGKKTEGIADPHFALARRHDPFQLNAYQGRFKGDQMKQMIALRRDAHPAWLKMNQTKLADPLPRDLPEQLAKGLLAAGLDEYALLARQLVVARRGRFDPVDHPEITKSLNRLAPGEVTDRTLKRLAGPTLDLLQLTRPEPKGDNKARSSDL